MLNANLARAYREWFHRCVVRVHQKRIVRIAGGRLGMRVVSHCFSCLQMFRQNQRWVRGVLDGAAAFELKVQGWCLRQLVGFSDRLAKVEKFGMRLLQVRLSRSWLSWIDHHTHMVGVRATAHRMGAKMMNRALAVGYYGLVDHRAAISVRRHLG